MNPIDIFPERSLSSAKERPSTQLNKLDKALRFYAG
jgi:hypothetical protein